MMRPPSDFDLALTPENLLWWASQRESKPYIADPTTKQLRNLVELGEMVYRWYISGLEEEEYVEMLVRDTVEGVKGYTSMEAHEIIADILSHAEECVCDEDRTLAWLFQEIEWEDAG